MAHLKLDKYEHSKTFDHKCEYCGSTALQVKKSTTTHKHFWIDDKKASKDEYLFAERLNKMDNIHCVIFQPKKIILAGGMKTKYGNYKDTTYTPDFFIYLNDDRKIIIEVKGFLRGDNGLKNKLADMYYNKIGYEYYVVKYLKGDFYFYNDSHKKQNTKTFWERVFNK